MPDTPHNGRGRQWARGCRQCPTCAGRRQVRPAPTCAHPEDVICLVCGTRFDLAERRRARLQQHTRRRRREDETWVAQKVNPQLPRGSKKVRATRKVWKAGMRAKYAPPVDL